MSNPKRIRPKGSESTYILESVSPTKSGDKVTYKGESYIKEELPAEFVMFEGVAYKRTMSIEQFNRKMLAESANGKAPNKIRLKGTDIVLEATDNKEGRK